MALIFSSSLFRFFMLSEGNETLERFTSKQNDHLYEKLKEIVVEHNFVIDMCNVMSKTFSPNVLIHFITSSLITCICCLMIMLADGASKLIFINYIIASTTQVYVYSIGGSMLEEASSNIAFAAYNFQWYKCDSRVQKQILMLIIRTQRKTGVNVPFFETSLETFGVVRKNIVHGGKRIM
jgi:gustatory receptor